MLFLFLLILVPQKLWALDLADPFGFGWGIGITSAYHISNFDATSSGDDGFAEDEIASLQSNQIAIGFVAATMPEEQFGHMVRVNFLLHTRASSKALSLSGQDYTSQTINNYVQHGIEIEYYAGASFGPMYFGLGPFVLHNLEATGSNSGATSYTTFGPAAILAGQIDFNKIRVLPFVKAGFGPFVFGPLPNYFDDNINIDFNYSVVEIQFGVTILFNASSPKQNDEPLPSI